MLHSDLCTSRLSLVGQNFPHVGKQIWNVAPCEISILSKRIFGHGHSQLEFQKERYYTDERNIEARSRNNFFAVVKQ